MFLREIENLPGAVNPRFSVRCAHVCRLGGLACPNEPGLQPTTKSIGSRQENFNLRSVFRSLSWLFQSIAPHRQLMIILRFLLPSLLLLAIAADLRAQGRGEELRSDLERTYRGWSGAITQRSMPMWEAQTATHRQVITHNFVVSRKAKWPDAIFDLPFRLPEIATLSHLATFEKGDTANLVYYGKVDFGVLEGRVPDNLLVLKFAREKGVWKFDNTRFFNLDADPAVRQLIANDQLEIPQRSRVPAHRRSARNPAPHQRV